MRVLSPDEERESVFAVNYEGLWRKGIRGLIFDLDNTLCPWRAPGLDAAAGKLLERLRERGFRICVLSNGDLSRREGILEDLKKLGIPVVYPARKPLPFGFRRALKHLGLGPGEAAVIGDQMFTDVLGGNRLGLHTVLVRPLSRREHPWTRYVMRTLERLAGRRGW